MHVVSQPGEEWVTPPDCSSDSRYDPPQEVDQGRRPG
jgi:hypothetical protein